MGKKTTKRDTGGQPADRTKEAAKRFVHGLLAVDELRLADQYATAAMTALLEDCDPWKFEGRDICAIAEKAWEVAWAMIEERRKRMGYRPPQSYNPGPLYDSERQTEERQQLWLTERRRRR